MELIFKNPKPVEPAEVMAQVRDHLSEILDRPVEPVRPSWFPRPVPDLLARDGDGGLYCIRWLDPDAWETQCPELLEDMFALERDLPRLVPSPKREDPSARGRSIQWVLVSDEVPEAWRRSAAMLAAPILFLQAHALTTHDTGGDVFYFEPLGPLALGRTASAGDATTPAGAQAREPGPAPEVQPGAKHATDAEAPIESTVVAAGATADAKLTELFSVLDAAETEAFIPLARLLAP